MDDTSGCAGFNEKVARQVRDVSSGHVTVRESAVRVTLMGPGRTPVRSAATGDAGVCGGTSTRAARRTMRIGADYRSNRLPGIELLCGFRSPGVGAGHLDALRLEEQLDDALPRFGVRRAAVDVVRLVRDDELQGWKDRDPLAHGTYG